MPLILGTNSIKDTGFEVANSCRFAVGDGAYLEKSYGTPTNAKIFGLSWWVKLGKAYDGSGSQDFWGERESRDNRVFMAINADGTFNYFEKNGGSVSLELKTNRLFRDNSAWFHFLLLGDTTQGTASNRLKLYINGVQETSFSTETYPAEDYTFRLNANTTKYFGRIGLGGSLSTNYYDGYLAEAVFVDGTVTAHTDYGEFDEDSPRIWKPIDVSGLTFGDNGFYLDFEDSSNLGNDANGGTDFTETNLATTDQSTDTPTNSFCTINPLDVPYGSVTLTEGNLVQVQTGGGSAYPYNRATMGVAKGKWYFEGKAVAISGDSVIGIASVAASSATNALYRPANNYAYYNHASTHGAYSDDALVDSTDYDDYDDDDIISVAFDLDNNKLYFAKNGTWAHSGDPTSGATGTGAVSITAAASTVDGFYFPAAADYGGSPRTTWSMNFGSPAHTVSSGNADGNGYGNFEHAPPSGYYALCTKNLAEYG